MSLAIAALITVSLAGCGGGAGTVGIASGITLFTTAPAAVGIPVGASVSYSIGGGTPIYSVHSSIPSVTNASIGGDGTGLTIRGLSSGVSVISIRDAAGATVTISVTVGNGGTTTALFTTAPGAVTIAPGGSASFNIGGGTAPYQSSTGNAGVATTGITGATLNIIGVAAGAAQIVIFDASGASITIDVTVGSGTAVALFTTAPGTLTLAPGVTASFTIGGGKPAYLVSSSNTAAATVGINGSTFIISGIAAGTAQVGVIDSTGSAVTINVTVGSGGTTTALYTTAASAITVAPGAAATFNIGGGTAPYSATSSNANVATTGVSGTVLSLNGVAAGTAQVLVFDATGSSVTIAVTVGAGGTTTALFTTAPGAITLAIGATNTFTIGGGSAPYVATSSNTSVASAISSGTTLTIYAPGAGTAQVLVFDASGASVTIDVTVSQPATTPPTPVSVLPDAASGNVGDVLQFLVSGGAPAYLVSVTNPSIATVSPASVAASGASFFATLLNAGSTSITIVDSLGQTTSIALTVSQTSTLLRLSPSAMLIAEDSTDSIALNIYGGTGPYSAFTSDQTLSSVSTSGSILTVGLGTNLNRCINPIDSSGVRVPNGTFDVTITVVDSLGASATSIMTLKDNGVGSGSVTVQPAPFVAPCT